MLKSLVQILSTKRDSKILNKRYFSLKNEKNYYDVLGLSSDASFESIRKRFFHLTKKYHPDIAKDDKSKALFQNIAEAYGILSNKELRREYDRSLGLENILETDDRSLEFTNESVYKHYESMKCNIKQPPSNFDDLNSFLYTEYYSLHQNEFGVNNNSMDNRSKESIVSDEVNSSLNVKDQPVIEPKHWGKFTADYSNNTKTLNSCATIILISGVFGVFIGYIQAAMKSDANAYNKSTEARQTYKGIYNKMLPITTF